MTGIAQPPNEQVLLKVQIPFHPSFRRCLRKLKPVWIQSRVRYTCMLHTVHHRSMLYNNKDDAFQTCRISLVRTVIDGTPPLLCAASPSFPSSPRPPRQGSLSTARPPGHCPQRGCTPGGATPAVQQLSHTPEDSAAHPRASSTDFGPQTFRQCCSLTPRCLQ